MTPGVYDLNLYRGDTYAWKFTLWQDAEKTLPVDLTGAVARAEIRNASGGTTVATLDCEITLPNVIDVRMTALMWEDAPSKGGGWDLEVTFLDGTVRTYVAGKVRVTGDITNSAVLTP